MKIICIPNLEKSGTFHSTICESEDDVKQFLGLTKSQIRALILSGEEYQGYYLDEYLG
jgi:hypothetical protein